MISFLMAVEDAKTRGVLEEIYVKYSVDLFNISYDILKNEFDAQDCVQDAVLKLVKYIDWIEEMENSHSKNFIFMVVRNTAYNLYQKNKNHKKIEIKYSEELSSGFSESTEDLVIRMEDINRIYKRLRKTKKEYVEIITLKYSYGFKINEVADVLCISESNARARLSRAKTAVKRELMKGDCFDE